MSNAADATDGEDDFGAEGPDDRANWSVRVLAPWIGGILVAASLAEAMDLYREVANLVLFREQYIFGFLSLALPAVYLSRPIKKGAPRLSVPWYDWIAAILGFSTCAYIAVTYPDVQNNIASRPPHLIVAAGIIIVLVGEGLRRATRLFLLLFLVAFLAYGLLGHHFPGHFQGMKVPLDRMLIYVNLDSNGLPGLPLHVVTTIVIPFIYFGILLSKAGGGEFFTDISSALMGRYRGGSAKIAVTASSLFGSISGSAIANIVSTGVVTIPLMRRAKFPGHIAGSVEAVASVGGQLMPPLMGATAFVIAEFLEVPYTEVVLAALIPAILYYVSLFIQVDLIAARDGIVGIPREELPNKGQVMRDGWLFLIPFIVIVLALFTFNLRASSAALWATASVIPIGLFFGYKKQRMGWKAMFEAAGETGLLVVQLMMVTSMAGIIIGVLNVSALGFALTLAIIEFAGNNLFLILLFGAIISIVLGMEMPTIGVYLLVAVLVVPSMTAVGIEPMAAHMFAFYFGVLALITPPVAGAAFAAATVANSDFLKTAVSAAIFGWPAYVVPFLFVLAPELIMKGDPLFIAYFAATATAGVWLTSVAWIGYFGGKLNVAQRMIFLAAGLATLMPFKVFPEIGIWIDVFGIGLGAVIVGARTLQAKRAVT